ncbi:hypothetical protein BD779DRAFT_426140 [Infundibulicybe gibba]|nr:hypothetical protein BD779DRAFT_426140 [Infundibulicybe gibba]
MAIPRLFPAFLIRIILRQICGIESQTIMFEQFHSSLDHLSNDLNGGDIGSHTIVSHGSN